jgi:hypothetical protein
MLNLVVGKVPARLWRVNFCLKWNDCHSTTPLLTRFSTVWLLSTPKSQEDKIYVFCTMHFIVSLSQTNKCTRLLASIFSNPIYVVGVERILTNNLEHMLVSFRLKMTFHDMRIMHMKLQDIPALFETMFCIKRFEQQQIHWAHCVMSQGHYIEGNNMD